MSGNSDIFRVERVSFESVSYATFSRLVKTEAIASVTASIARRGKSDRVQCRPAKDFTAVFI